MRPRIPQTLFLCALATMSLVACEKESPDTHPQTVQPAEEKAEGIQLYYEIDGTSQTLTVYNREALASTVSRLASMAQEGCRVCLKVIGQQTIAGAKDVVKYNTTDKEKFDKWVLSMLEQGYDVVVEYDNETGTYHGTAVKE